MNRTVGYVYGLSILRIKIKMIINLIKGLFTKQYPIDIYRPSNWETEEILQYEEVITNLENIYSENADKETAMKLIAKEIEKLPSGSILLAHRKLMVKTDYGWVKI